MVYLKMMLLLALFSHALLSAAAWTQTAPSLSLHLRHYCKVGMSGRRQTTTMSARTNARALFATVAITPSTSFTKLFAKAASEDSHILPQQQQQPPKRWKLFAGRNLVDGGSEVFRWTPLKIMQALVVFVLAGIAEIGGGWLVWKAVREHKPWWWALAGSLILVLYGFIPTLQPTDSFGRIYAVYGGFFIALSYAWGWVFDGMKPDTGDVVGGSLALLAVLVILFWPRQQ